MDRPQQDNAIQPDALYQDFNAPERPWPLSVEHETGAVLCEVRWHAPLQVSRNSDYFYRVDAHGGHLQSMELPSWRTTLKMKTTPGQWYTVEVKAIATGGRVLGVGRAEFKAVFTREEMIRSYETCVDFVGDSMRAFDVFYRCKPKPYFDNIKFNRASIMEVYLKDNNGQAASPINGVINGLFFSARLSGNQVPKHSPFGNIRMCVPASRLFDLEHHRLWFADYYCNYVTHYVTVVCTLRGSEVDQYCERCLIPLNPSTNPFLRCIPAAENPNWCEYWVNRKVWVEFYYTENIPLNWGRFDRIMALFGGTSKPGGLPHNKHCTICNLYPIAPPSAAKHDQNDKSGDDQDFAGVESI